MFTNKFSFPLDTDKLIAAGRALICLDAFLSMEEALDLKQYASVFRHEFFLCMWNVFLDPLPDAFYAEIAYGELEAVFKEAFCPKENKNEKSLANF